MNNEFISMLSKASDDDLKNVYKDYCKIQHEHKELQLNKYKSLKTSDTILGMSFKSDDFENALLNEIAKRYIK